MTSWKRAIGYMTSHMHKVQYVLRAIYIYILLLKMKIIINFENDDDESGNSKSRDHQWTHLVYIYIHRPLSLSIYIFKGEIMSCTNRNHFNFLFFLRAFNSILISKKNIYESRISLNGIFY